MAPRILVVDDNQELLSLLTQLFEDAGYTVAAANRGKQALEVARATRPEVAVLDILLPDMMGYHLADALRREQPALPLLFITGVFKGGKHALEARQKYDAVAYFEKPFEAKKLLETVAGLVTPAPRARPAAAVEDAFDVELEIDVVEESQDPMELTGRIRVTGGGDVSAELRGKALTAGPVTSPPAGPKRASGTGIPVPHSGVRRGDLRDNLPSL